MALRPTARDEAIAAGILEAKFRGVYEEGDETLIGLESNRYLNMVGGMRPSDAAHDVVRWYLADPVKFRTDFHNDRKK